MNGKLLFAAFVLIASIFGTAIQTPRDDNRVVVDTSENPYRLTRFGWQDARHWRTDLDIAQRSTIHPLWVSAAFLLVILGVVVWSSEEDELAPLFGRHFVENGND